jgi:hypothetical protein
MYPKLDLLEWQSLEHHIMTSSGSDLVELVDQVGGIVTSLPVGEGSRWLDEGYIPESGPASSWPSTAISGSPLGALRAHVLGVNF